MAGVMDSWGKGVAGYTRQVQLWDKQNMTAEHGSVCQEKHIHVPIWKALKHWGHVGREWFPTTWAVQEGKYYKLNNDTGQKTEKHPSPFLLLIHMTILFFTKVIWGFWMLKWPVDASLGAQAETHKWYSPGYCILGWLLVTMMESAWGCWDQGECVNGS